MAAASLLILLIHTRLLTSLLQRLRVCFSSYTSVTPHEDHVLPAPTLRGKLNVHTADHGGFAILAYKIIRMLITLALVGLSLLPHLGERSKNAASLSSILFAAEVRHQRLATTQILTDLY